jgi:hypothetical protein
MSWKIKSSHMQLLTRLGIVHDTKESQQVGQITYGWYSANP